MPKKSWLESLIDEEGDAVNEYMELSDMLKTMNKRKSAKLVKGIAEDEYRHKEILTLILKDLEKT